MLTYMEQKAPIYNSINFMDRLLLQTNPQNHDGPETRTINSFLCPVRRPSFGALTTPPNGGSRTAMPGSQGTTVQANPSTSTGLFSTGADYGLRDIIDGSSNTVAYSEKLCGVSGKPTYRGNGVNASSPVGYQKTPGRTSRGVLFRPPDTCTMSSLQGPPPPPPTSQTNTGKQWWIVGSESYIVVLRRS